MKTPLAVSIGITAYNEGKNIAKLLNSLLGNQLDNDVFKTKEILVISSGSVDNTNQIVMKYCQANPKMKLICQDERLGKVSAVNLFLSKAKSSTLVLIGADMRLKKDTLKRLIEPFLDQGVGMTGAHPIPTNNLNNFMGFAAHLLWKLHHEISLKEPKMGEMIAFRRVFKQIPILSVLDEVQIEALIKGQGYKAVYVADAVVWNKGPTTAGEFIIQRRRNFAGHLATKKEYSYQVSTINPVKIFFVLLKNIEWNLNFFLYTPGVIMLEVISRLLGWYDYYISKRDLSVWQIAPSTKRL